MSTAEMHAAAELLAELESNRLEVVLVPERRRTCEGGMIRVAASKNAPWYRRFCLSYPSSRVRRNSAPDTRIKRRQVQRTLERMAAGQVCRGVYTERLAPVVAHRAGKLQRAEAAA